MQAAFDNLRKRKDVDPNRIVVYGHSLGCGPAIYLTHAVNEAKRKTNDECSTDLSNALLSLSLADVCALPCYVLSLSMCNLTDTNVGCFRDLCFGTGQWIYLGERHGERDLPQMVALCDL